MRALKWWLVALGAIGLTALAVGTYLYVTAPERLVRGALAYERRVAGLERKEITLTGGLRYVYLEGGRVIGVGADCDQQWLIDAVIQRQSCTKIVVATG